MKPIAVSGYETDRSRLVKFAVMGGIVVVVLGIFFGTLSAPDRKPE